PFPGGSGPDLVVVVVVTLALGSGPRDGALIGFAAGLALDIAPPASNLLGQSALVFCLVGYGCGRLRVTLERSAWLPVAGVALGVAAGEALYALVGVIFGDPDVSWQAVRQVLPAAVFYDLLLSPFVLYAVARLGGYARWGADTAPAGPLTGPGLGGAGGGPPPGRGPAQGGGPGPRGGGVAGVGGRRGAPHRGLDRRAPGTPWPAGPAGRRLGSPAPCAAAAAARRRGRLRDGGSGGRAPACAAAGHRAPAARHAPAARWGDRGPAVPGGNRAGR